jgi:hypothetical protein
LNYAEFPSFDDEINIRICYYTKQQRGGTEFWNIAPRPLSFEIEDAVKVKNAIDEMLNKSAKL